MVRHRFPHQISFAFCILALCIGHSSAQTSSIQRTPGALNMGSSLGYAAAFPIVREVPYTAEVVTQQWKIGPDGRTVLHEAFNIHMRDAAGRVRDEQLASPLDEVGSFIQSMVRVIDPVSMQQTEWNNDDKTIVITPIPTSFTQYRRGPMPCDGVSARRPKADQAVDTRASGPVSTSLGVKTMEGLRVVGCRTTQMLVSAIGGSMTSTSEIWFSPALHIAVLESMRYSDGSGMLTKLSNILQSNPEPALFEPPIGYTKPGERREPENSNPNYAKIREYGHIDWHGTTAQLVAGGSRPLDMAALTLSSCLGIWISAEDPHYNWTGDLLDVTDPRWAAQHSDHHLYAAKPGKVTLSFEVNEEGRPVDAVKILEDAVDQVNQQQPWQFRLQHDVRGGHDFYSFVPTASHNESGQLEKVGSWLDDRVAIASSTAPVYSIAGSFAEALSSQTGYQFNCCQAMVIGRPWGSQTIHYEATDQLARLTLEDLMIAAGGNSSYVQRCEPMDKRFCFINVGPALNRIPKSAPQSGVCGALGYDPD
jgi:hypothetical protein